MCGLLLVSHAASAAPSGPNAAAYRALAAQTEDNLHRQVLAKWFPAAIDAAGGFHQNFSADWQPTPDAEQNIVYQARLTWVASEAALHYPQQAAQYRAAARHGLAFLQNDLWDAQDGGWYWDVHHGRPTADRGTEKHAYGISFGIYACCAAFRATHDPAARQLAERAFHWLDAHAHDDAHGGYYEALTRNGRPILAPQGKTTSDSIGTVYGFKSMNTHIHLLESFTALYEIWPDAHLHTRLEEMFATVRDKIVTEPGCMNLYFTPAWRPVPDYDSYGHDVETAYLLTEAAAVLGKPDDARTWAVARSLVDHALAYGWDSANGGFYDQGRALGAATSTSKIWWEQAEGLNALLLMHARYGKTTPRYWQAFEQEWHFIQKHQIDPAHGGWYNTVTAAGVPTPAQGKSDGWTEAYHQGRALMNVTATLRHLATENDK